MTGTDYRRGASGALALPTPSAIAVDRLERLKARIDGGHYPVQPRLIADAILSHDEDGPCGSSRAIGLTLAARVASKD